MKKTNEKGISLVAFIITLIILAIAIGVVIVIIVTSNKNGGKDNDNKENTSNTVSGNNVIKNNNVESGKEEMSKMVKENSNLPVVYMSKYNEEDSVLKDYKYVDNYMSDDFYGDDIFFSYYGYPNDEADFYLGKIELKTNKYNLFGVTVGDNFNQAIEKLEKFGFERKSAAQRSDAEFTYKDFTISIDRSIPKPYRQLEESEYTVGTISIEADSEYLGNLIY